MHFATVGGTGGIADTCKLYRTLKIPVAVIADLDLIADLRKLRRVLEVMTSQEKLEHLVGMATSIVEGIKKLPPTIEPREVRSRLAELAGTSESWDGDADVALRRELSKIGSQLDRMRKLKRGGLSSFPADQRAQLAELLSQLKACGVFLVPVGELEEWLPNEKIEESKDKKWAWANAAALHLQSTEGRQGDIWDFVRKVGEYLSPR